MSKQPNLRRIPRRFHDIDVAVWLAAPFVLTVGVAMGCGSDSSPQTPTHDAGLDQKTLPRDTIPPDSDTGPGAPDAPMLEVASEGPDAPALEVASEGPLGDDGGSCQAPNVWRYQEPGCGAEAHPVCGSAMQDAGLALACGCDGETLMGFDYYDKPWRARGLCPDACFSPTLNLEVAVATPSIKGCACDPASDTPQCVSVGGWGRALSCVGGTWKLDYLTNCSVGDGGTVSVDGAIDRSASDDGGSCQAPNVWRYQEPGCGAEAHPVCGSGMQDGGLAFACGCDGETLMGCDYYDKPWRARGMCPGACYSPTSNLEVAWATPLMKGCTCDPSTNGTECVSMADGKKHPVSCVAGTWSLDASITCTGVDGGVSLDGGGAG